MTDPKYPETTFPDPLATNEEKATPAFGLIKAKFIFGKYRNAPSSIYNRIGRYINNRKYAEGLQSIQKYKDMMDMSGDTSYLNLDFQVVPVLPKFVDLMVGEMINQELQIQCNAIDPQSLTKYEDEKNAIFANLMLKPFSDQMEEMTGVPIIDKSKYIPKDEEDAKLYMEMTFKQDTEVAMEELLSFVFQNNGAEELKTRLIRDFVVLKIAAVRVDFDSNNDIILRYVDPATVVTPYSDKQNFTDMEYAGETIKMTIHDLKQQAGSQLTDEDYFNIARFNVGKYNNPANWQYGDTYGAYYNRGGINTAYDNYYVQVFDFEFASNNYNLTFEKKINNYGGYFYNQKKAGYTPAENSRGKREVQSKDFQVRYEGKWIVGTDCIYDYGLQKNMRRPKKGGVYSNKCLSRYIICAPDIYDMENKSFVERCISHADQIQLCYLKLQQLVSKAVPKGISFDVSVLEGVVMGKGTSFLTPLEVLSAYKQTGDLPYRGTDPDTGQPIGKLPINELPNGMSGDIERLVGLYNFHLQMIRDVTGVNEMRDGSSPDARLGASVQRTALQTSRNTSRPLNNSYLSVIKRMAEQVALMLQDKAAFGGGLDGYYNAVGENAIKIIEVGKGISLAEFGIAVELVSTAEDQQLLENDMAMALQAGNIDLEDEWEVRILGRKNIKKAVRLLKKRREDKLKAAQEAQAQQQQQQGQIQAQSAQAATQGQLAYLQAETQAKAQLLQLEYSLKIELEKAKKEGEAAIEEIKGHEKLKQIDLVEQHGTEQMRMEESVKPRVFGGGI